MCARGRNFATLGFPPLSLHYNGRKLGLWVDTRKTGSFLAALLFSSHPPPEPACVFTVHHPALYSHILMGFGFSVAVAHRICYLSRESTGAAVSAAGRRAGGRCFLPPCCGPALPPSLGLLSTVGQCPKEFPCSSPARPTDRLRGRDRPCHPFTRSAISGEMHDPLLDDCFSVCLFRGVAIASASGEHASARRRRQFLFETKNSQP